MRKHNKKQHIYGQKWITPWITLDQGGVIQKAIKKTKFCFIRRTGVLWITRITPFSINLLERVKVVTNPAHLVACIVTKGEHVK